MNEKIRKEPSSATIRLMDLISDCNNTSVIATVIDSLRSRGAAAAVNKVKRLNYRISFMQVSWFILTLALKPISSCF